MTMSSQLLADDNKSKEEPLPLNDPFVETHHFQVELRLYQMGHLLSKKE